MEYKYDVFISYSTYDLELVKQLANYLEEKVEHKIRCFYANRDIPQGINYAKAIVEALKSSRLMVVVFSENFNKSDHVDRELELACDEFKKPILTFKIENVKFDGAKMYYLKNLNWIEAYTNSTSKFNLLSLNICKILGINKSREILESKNYRRKNDYFNIEDNEEVERLRIQMELLEDFDKDVYDRILSSRQNIKVLDIGTNFGRTIMNRVASNDNVDIIIGVDINEDAIISANKEFAGCKGYFYKLDIESKNFIQELKTIMKIHGIKKFDLINMSMVLLHLENPQKMIREIQKVLDSKGQIFIRDIDDGLNIAYPDHNNYFKKAMEICSRNEDSGFRNSGREIPTLLMNAELKDIRLEKMCINSLGMDYDRKDAFFNTYFSFIKNDTIRRYEKDPNTRVNIDDYEWVMEYYDSLEESFHAHNFFFCLGFVIYTATKS